MSTRDGQIIGLDGQSLYIKGINYFGYETGNTFLDGYWHGEVALTDPENSRLDGRVVGTGL